MGEPVLPIPSSGWLSTLSALWCFIAFIASGPLVDWVEALFPWGPCPRHWIWCMHSLGSGPVMSPVAVACLVGNAGQEQVYGHFLSCFMLAGGGHLFELYAP